MSPSNRRTGCVVGGLRLVARTAVLHAMRLFAIHLFAVQLFTVAPLKAQDPPPDSAAAAVQAPPEGGGLPIFLTVGIGYSQRFDKCAYCANRRNIRAFTGHASIGKYVVGGLGVGVDASVWRRNHPGVPEVDSLGVTTPTTLLDQLGNASMTLSFATWHVFFRAGVGVAMRSQDMQDSDGDVTTASGVGIGYSLGGGATLPLASLASLVLFVNWNVGRYDLSTPVAVIKRGVKHRYVELGFGLTVR